MFVKETEGTKRDVARELFIYILCLKMAQMFDMDINDEPGDDLYIGTDRGDCDRYRKIHQKCKSSIMPIHTHYINNKGSYCVEDAIFHGLRAHQQLTKAENTLFALLTSSISSE